MKIAILEPYIEGIGGAQKVIAQYSKYLLSRGHDVEIFTQRYDPSDCYSDFKDLKISLVGSKSKFLSPLAFFREFKGFDIIIANDWPTHFASLKNDNVLWVCYTPKRDFYDLRDFYRQSVKSRIISSLKEFFFKRLDYEAAIKAKAIFTNSKNTASRVKKYYGRQAEWVFYHGINFSEFSGGKMSDYFLSVGRLVSNKRTENIVQAMKFVKSKDVRLLIAGDGPQKSGLKTLAGNDARIKFLGRVDDEQKKKLYSQAIALVCVPISEDWGLTPIEAAASSVPTIGVDEGGLRETIINGKTGFLLKTADPKAISQKIDYLFNNKKIALRMGLQARKYVSAWDIKKILPIFEKKIKSLASSKK